jgi:hypothetical protein
MGSEKDKGANEETKSTSSEKLVSPVHGFSAEFPSSWKITSRYRKLAFGKWGIEREAVRSTPAENPNGTSFEDKMNRGPMLKYRCRKWLLLTPWNPSWILPKQPAFWGQVKLLITIRQYSSMAYPDSTLLGNAAIQTRYCHHRYRRNSPTGTCASTFFTMARISTLLKPCGRLKNLNSEKHARP